MIDGLRIKRADGTWTDKGGGGEQWVSPPPPGITNMTSMFNGWNWLASAPEMDTSSVTNMSSMFWGCSSLESIPLLDTSSVTNASNMFSGCSSLESIPLLDTSSVTNVTSMFNGCSSLTAIDLDLSQVTTSATTWGSNISQALVSLTSCLLNGLTRSISIRWTAMEAPALNAMFDSLGQAASGATITITGAPGAAACDRTIATDKGWTVVG